MGTQREQGDGRWGNPRLIAGRYRLDARLGRGGMGVVWRATDRLLRRQVAVKELLLDETLSADEVRQQRDRTLREARAVAQLSHPHIIVVHDVVEHDERPFIVMELIDGCSLAERISTHGPLDAPEAARIGIALLSALRTAHAAGVLHRDLKPANVLLEPATGRVVLTDFGIARLTGAPTLTESGTFVGSPEYTAPERMTGARTGPESDLWSLGALLCATLSGESPFRRDSLGGIVHAVIDDDIRPPVQAEPLLPVVRGLLDRDPDQRLDAERAERMLRDFLDMGRLPPQAVQYRRRMLVGALLVAAMAGAGVSAAALLMNDGGGTPGPEVSVSAPAGYRVVEEPAGFSLAVPEGFTRRAQGLYVSRGETFRLSVRISEAEPGGPLGAMRRAHAKGPDAHAGYREGRVIATAHHGHAAARREFTWNAEGMAKRTYELWWQEDGRLYELQVSAPVGEARQGRAYFDVALDTFMRA
ncbi:serine/threonine-protein kinase [Streptomyces sp. DG2A-72]|uniref:serine/threonine-protein kinase n=1 Tax=Streptomyces sp. DG2A-72 TaxID=3051386 RepID=UPI00265C787E|nr:serine/threonine-protein kinase [Streptomyces sp. DG2A-72]MDO0935694.1 serine/threonine-protein kinase [Streptomyces sp. DG2A-72]